MKKILLLIVFLFLLPSSVYGADATNTSKTIDIGYYDVWVRSDGVTWLNDKKPGDTVTYSYEVTYSKSDIDKVIGVKDAYFYDGNSGEWEESGRTDSWLKFKDSSDKIGEIAKDEGGNKEIEYLGNGEVKITVTTTLDAADPDPQTKEWQNENVKGLRYYVPTVIVWELEPVDQTLIIDYVDKNGNPIADSTVIENIEPGTYNFEAKKVDGYYRIDPNHFYTDDELVGTSMGDTIKITITADGKMIINE